MLFETLRHFVPLTISSAFYAAGYATGLLAFYLAARNRGLATEGMFKLMVAGLIGGLLFANIAQWTLAGTPGKTILGGIAGGYLTVALMKRRLGIVRPTGDLFAIALSAGEAVGRFGCFFAGCCGGRPTHVPWAVLQDGRLCHPTQLYMAASSTVILAILLGIDRLKPRENTLFCVQGLLYCISRFTIEFFREAPPIFAGLTLAQLACAAGLVFFAFRMAALYGLAARLPAFAKERSVDGAAVS